MAFRHPTTYHAPPRQLPSQPQPLQTTPQTTQDPSIRDSQEWILFSPGAADSTATSTARTRTAGLSHISDFGSLDTAARSYGYSVDDASSQAVDEDGELDSLDSHLHEFRTEPSVYRGETRESGTVLPTHDGLGSFRVDGAGQEVQEHLYAFERYNPRRRGSVKRRRDSVELGFLDDEVERTRRIERWRMEQSRLLVDEIQKETRRRKQSLSSERRVSVSVADKEREDEASMNTDVGKEGREEEGFWSRITRRVIRDLMGVDDELLSIIFGESLPQDDDLSSTPKAHSHNLVPVDDSSSWEYRLLERIARELGILVSQISDHPGAFSTYLKTATAPLPYAGLPVIPETSRPLTQTSQDPAEPKFRPTLPLPIPSSTSLAPPAEQDINATPRASAMSREEWEKELDINLVFRYLRSRFSSSPSKPPTSPFPDSLSLSSPNFTTSHLATASTADTAARAARVRAHHPLVKNGPGGRRRVDGRTWKVSVPAGGEGGLKRRGSSSCASETGKGAGGSSRHYWDFGGRSSGSAGSFGGGMGSWGEV